MNNFDMKNVRMMTFTGYSMLGFVDPDSIDVVTGKKFKNVKSKHEYPYTYDEFLQWEVKSNTFKGYANEDSAVYSDRLYQWDPTRYNENCRYVFGNEGQYWDNRNPEDIEKFLRLQLEDQTISLQWIIEGCNPSSGYPYWVFGTTRGVK